MRFVLLVASAIGLTIVTSATINSWLGITVSHFYAYTPILVPILATAGTALLMTYGLVPPEWHWCRILGGWSLFFMLMGVSFMAIAGILQGGFDLRYLSDELAAISFDMAVMACLFVSSHWCVALCNYYSHLWKKRREEPWW